MSNDALMYMLIGVGIAFVIIVIAYLLLRNKMQSSGVREIQKLREGTEEKKFTKEILYQKLYVFYLKIPFVKRYLLKIRRRLEIINIDDEYLTRGQASKILTSAILVIIPFFACNINPLRQFLHGRGMTLKKPFAEAKGHLRRMSYFSSL